MAAFKTKVDKSVRSIFNQTAVMLTTFLDMRHDFVSHILHFLILYNFTNDLFLQTPLQFQEESINIKLSTPFCIFKHLYSSASQNRLLSHKVYFSLARFNPLSGFKSFEQIPCSTPLFVFKRSLYEFYNEVKQELRSAFPVFAADRKTLTFLHRMAAFGDEEQIL